jgi:hypothetical protein
VVRCGKSTKARDRPQASLKYQYFDFGVRREDGSNSVTWYFGDHLGGSRVVLSTAANDNSDFYPFGRRTRYLLGYREHLQNHRQRS